MTTTEQAIVDAVTAWPGELTTRDIVNMVGACGWHSRRGRQLERAVHGLNVQGVLVQVPHEGRWRWDLNTGR